MFAYTLGGPVSVTGPWEILETTEYAAWFAGLTEKQQSAIRERVVLLGGIKSGANKWNAWYAESVPRADELMDRHLAEMRRRHGN